MVRRSQSLAIWEMDEAISHLHAGIRPLGEKVSNYTSRHVWIRGYQLLKVGIKLLWRCVCAHGLCVPLCRDRREIASVSDVIAGPSIWKRKKLAV